jgi:hypothetical protein
MKKNSPLTPSVLIFMIRLGIAFLFAAYVFFIFWPKNLNSVAETLPIRQIFVGAIQGHVGFDQDWLSVASLITVSIYIYAYLTAILVASNLWFLPRAEVFQNANGRHQWNLLAYITLGKSNNLGASADSRSISAAIRDYSKSRTGIRTLVRDLILILAISYIGYSALQKPPTNGGLLVRAIDALMVGFWCYLIFAIFMWFVFVLAAWIYQLNRSI